MSTFLAFLGCATTSNPCALGGDTMWMSSRYPDGRIPGDRHCKQKKTADGTYVNHGAYSITFPEGGIALEGRFEEGKKEGFWWEYDSNGQRIAEKYFEKGIEKSPAQKPEK